MIDNWTEALSDGHAILFGRTRYGKSGLLELMVRSILKTGLDGVTIPDLHGSLARNTFEFIANPQNGLSKRRVHFIDPKSCYTVGFNPLQTPEATPEAWHEAALTVSAVIEADFESPPEQTPRLSKILYLSSHLCASKGLTLLEVLEVLSLGGNALRDHLMSGFDSHIHKRELDDLFQLARTRPQLFLEYVESAKSRLVRRLGSRSLMRMLGQRSGINPRSVMDRREIVLFDLGSLPAQDAAFVGKLVSATYFTHARARPPMRSARHRLILDEGESMLTIYTARTFDQTGKFGLYVVVAVQRLGHLRDKGAFILDALMTNTAIKMSFAMPDADAARYLTEQFHTGHISLNEWKQGSERPVVTDHEKAIVRNSSRAQHDAVHESEGWSHSTHRAIAHGVTDSTGRARGSGSSRQQMSSLSMQPNAGLLMPTPTPGQTISMWAPTALLGQTAAASSGSNSFEASQFGTASTRILTEGEADAESYAQGRSSGTSLTAGEGEVFVSKIEWLPSSTYTLEEQFHRLAGALMNLEKRQCIVKIGSSAPVCFRTRDLSPAFTSADFKRIMLPAYERTMIARSSYLVPVSDVDRDIAARLKAFTNAAPVPEPNLGVRETIPILDDPDAYAKGFLERRSAMLPDPPRKPNPKSSRKSAERAHKPTLVVSNDGDSPDGGDVHHGSQTDPAKSV